MRIISLGSLMTALIVAGTASAHHSFTATYDETTEISIEGTLVQFMFRNPHSFVHVMAPDQNGEMLRWAVEWGGAAVLGRQGVSRHTLKVGDRVIVTGNPGRNAVDRRLRMQTLERPADQFIWGKALGETFE